MSNKLIVVFPKDDTTIFLEDIVQHIYSHAHICNFEVILLRIESESQVDAVETIRNAEGSWVLFLGHGSSHGLHCSGTQNRSIFINSTNADCLSGKFIMLLACNSADFIRKFYGFTDAIGFGDLPTDWNDILSARNSNHLAYRGITEATINTFKTELVSIVKCSFVEFMYNPSNAMELMNSMRLRLNKRIVFYNLRAGDYRILSDLFYNVKKELLHLNGIRNATG